MCYMDNNNSLHVLLQDAEIYHFEDKDLRYKDVFKGVRPKFTVALPKGTICKLREVIRTDEMFGTNIKVTLMVEDDIHFIYTVMLFDCHLDDYFLHNESVKVLYGK